MKKSINISIEGNNIRLKERGITMYARLDTRRSNTKGEHPIRIRIIHKGIVRDYGTKQSATSDQFERIVAKRPQGTEADIKIAVIELLDRAYGIVQSVDPFSFSSFNDLYLNKRNNDLSNVYNWYEDKIRQLKENGQLGTAITYNYSMESLISYTGNDKLRFDDINIKFLENFEKWMTSEGKSPTTIGIYLRPLRHIINLAIDHPSNLVKEYPFKNYKIPTPRSIKKALSKADLKAIYEYPVLKGSAEAYYKDIWLFSYFANGINIKDICKLKYKDVKGDFIEFKRAKTMRTNKDTKPISISLTEDLKRIIEEYGTRPIEKNNFIFDFLKSGMTDEQEMAAIKQAVKQTNKYIKRIAEVLEIKAVVTSYTARHSFATILKNAGVAPAFIGESLGHSSLSTTESYLGSFENDAKQENAKKLKDW